MSNTKYIFITGGVVSSLGKGIVAASLAKLLQARGYKVTIQKFDPYINVDPGTLNPYEHGEVYVTEDGAETDLDLGHYERFLNVPTSKANNVTTGRIYLNVIEKERRGDYGGKTVQVVPHITDEIKRSMRLLSQTGQYDIIITEIGGTVGDIESLPFLEAARQVHYETPANDTLFIHLTLIPYINVTNELKTKPTQHSVKHLLELGIQPDILVCRTEHKLSADLKAKIALFCNVDNNSVIEALDAETIYDVPLKLKREQFDLVVLFKLGLPPGTESDLNDWRNFLQRLKNPNDEVSVGLVGKYVELPDAYKSILESIVHAGAATETKVNVTLIHSEDIQEENVARWLQPLHGVIVAPGFGKRGIAGKITATKYCRENHLPFLGICLGMQIAVIEFGMNVLNLEDCNSTEIEPNAQNPVISLIEGQQNNSNIGGTLRLGAWKCSLAPNSKIRSIYSKDTITERHRHRYEFNNKYRSVYESAGMKLSGINPDLDLVEAIELEDHPFFIGCQYHPEYKSTVLHPHPLFIALIKAMLKKKYS